MELLSHYLCQLYKNSLLENKKEFNIFINSPVFVNVYTLSFILSQFPIVVLNIIIDYIPIYVALVSDKTISDQIMMIQLNSTEMKWKKYVVAEVGPTLNLENFKDIPFVNMDFNETYFSKFINISAINETYWDGEYHKYDYPIHHYINKQTYYWLYYDGIKILQYKNFFLLFQLINNKRLVPHLFCLHTQQKTQLRPLIISDAGQFWDMVCNGDEVFCFIFRENSSEIYIFNILLNQWSIRMNTLKKVIIHYDIKKVTKFDDDRLCLFISDRWTDNQVKALFPTQMYLYHIQKNTWKQVKCELPVCVDTIKKISDNSVLLISQKTKLWIGFSANAFESMDICPYPFFDSVICNKTDDTLLTIQY